MQGRGRNTLNGDTKQIFGLQRGSPKYSHRISEIVIYNVCNILQVYKRYQLYHHRFISTVTIVIITAEIITIIIRSFCCLPKAASSFMWTHLVSRFAAGFSLLTRLDYHLRQMAFNNYLTLWASTFFLRRSSKWDLWEFGLRKDRSLLLKESGPTKSATLLSSTILIVSCLPPP